MSEDQIVRNCAPTLAGIKTGSLFNVSISKGSDFRHDIALFNKSMRNKGIRIIPLKVSEKYALIYLYRPAAVSLTLSEDLIRLLNSLMKLACSLVIRRSMLTALSKIQMKDSMKSVIGKCIRMLRMQEKHSEDLNDAPMNTGRC